MDRYNKLLASIRGKTAVVGVMGIGHVGLPLAVTFANTGYSVIGYDINKQLVNTVNKGELPFIEEKMDEVLPKVVENNKFTATTSTDDLKDCDVIIITVGTPLTKQYQADLKGYLAVLETISNFAKGKLLVTRTTSAPGTFKDLLIPVIQNNSGLTCDQDFWASVCPERIVEGKALTEIVDLPEIIGAKHNDSFELTKALFLNLNPDKIIERGTPTEAELAKIYCNVFRYVKFALANEFGLLCEGKDADPYNVIRMANNGYSRGGIPVPGLTGGPCLSKDGYFLIQDNLYNDFIMTAWRLNEFMPNYLIEKLKQNLQKRGELTNSTTVGQLGVSFKAGSDDTRYSPAISMLEILKNSGFKTKANDPYVEEDYLLTFDETIKDVDVVIVAINHPEYYGIEEQLSQHKVKIVVDCWGIIDQSKLEDIEVLTIGS